MELIKVIKKLTTAGCLGIVLFASQSNISSAATPLTNAAAFWKCTCFSNAKIADIQWYKDPSVEQFGFNWHVNTAKELWDAVPGANIGFQNVTSSDNADLRFFAGDYYWSETYGILAPYDKSGNEIPGSLAYLDNPTVVFYKAHIRLNNYTMNNVALPNGGTRQMSGNEKLDVVTHELGHVLKLKHQDDGVPSIMQRTNITQYGNVPQLDKSNVAFYY
ncbi:hypothetical protein [Paenibacillus sp. UNC499MF]|uniref:hypothetical protein n=1 Tax=Paenibacillus sp. UNC499MF TaxID=1502751 RepID=UPI0008A00CDB|nr:hypothetical protein [Paenibacillus sp. UNC499MF]SEG57236.1 hypothetical protein SAMN02799616_03590 [Paenibacillus sp. UNC499MF]